MRSLTSPRMGCTSEAEKFRPSAEKDFFNSIGAKRTFGLNGLSKFGRELRGSFLPLIPVLKGCNSERARAMVEQQSARIERRWSRYLSRMSPHGNELYIHICLSLKR